MLLMVNHLSLNGRLHLNKVLKSHTPTIPNHPRRKEDYSGKADYPKNFKVSMTKKHS